MRRLLAPLIFVGASLACAHGPYYQNQLQPPQYDLKGYPAVGLIQFTSQKPKLAAFATERFLAELQKAQPGVRIVELGTQQQALAAVGKQLDVDALHALGQKYNVAALFAGNLDVTDAKPAVQMSGLLSGNIGVSAKVTTQLTARLYETGSGVTVWTGSQGAEDQTGSVNIGGGDVDVAAQGADNAYARMVEGTTHAIADPFRSHWVRVQVPDNASQ